ncbi:hypothetical protein TRAPUB_5672 [Trametes pubescens]|uniref:Uncharacterized protein n=1 Tax=Trametes pubescens TaxID=154538 RepID=A0A1M2V7T6_TRAPU|nr:hypothetical protein TRAPUB_5672 [Trametes pubescens]
MENQMWGTILASLFGRAAPVMFVVPPAEVGNEDAIEDTAAVTEDVWLGSCGVADEPDATGTLLAAEPDIATEAEFAEFTLLRAND